MKILIFCVIGLTGMFLSAGDEIGYCVLNFYIIMPLITLIVSLIISMKIAYMFWFYHVFVGILGIIIPFVLFRTFDEIALFFGFIPALIGLIIGLTIRVSIKKRN